MFLLLLISYSQLFSHLYQGGVACPSVKIEKGTNPSPSVLLKKSADLEEVYFEQEEEDRFSFKKYLEAGHHFFSFFYLPPFGRTLDTFEKYAHSGNCFFSYSSHNSRHIVFGVFRI